jgi:isopentenyl-diphosphate Delta-isomerase
MEEQIILVDKNDVRVGCMGKLETHRKGELHRAFSIFIKNSKGELMLQKRADDKYHSGGLWTNTCCGHPRDSEELLEAAHRRLNEEMGFDCPFEEVFKFQYQTNFEHGLIENEIDHIFVGQHDSEPVLNPVEASDWKWMTVDKIKSDIIVNPDDYTYWFKIAMNKAEELKFNF